MPIDLLINYFRNLRKSDLDPLEEYWPSLDRSGTRVVGYYQNLVLSSVYQPIVSRSEQNIIGYEALLRAIDPAGNPVAPEDVFRLPRSSEDATYLDRLCRVLHVLNLLRQPGQGLSGYLFLNVTPRHLQELAGDHGRAFEAILRFFGLTPDKVVLEVLESEIEDIDRLKRAIANYRARGYRIAIDDFGRRHSNFDRLWLLEPDIVKFDRSLLLQAEQDARIRRVLPRLVEIVHELDAKTILEGVENATQMQLALDAGVDWIQGYHLGRPSPDLVTEPASEAVFWPSVLALSH